MEQRGTVSDNVAIRVTGMIPEVLGGEQEISEGGDSFGDYRQRHIIYMCHLVHVSSFLCATVSMCHRVYVSPCP